MPRAVHPIDKVLDYFQTAPLDAAEQALHVAKGILKARAQAHQAVQVGASPGTSKSKSRKRGPNKPKPQVPAPTLTPAQAGAEGGE